MAKLFACALIVITVAMCANAVVDEWAGDSVFLRAWNAFSMGVVGLAICASIYRDRIEK